MFNLYHYSDKVEFLCIIVIVASNQLYKVSVGRYKDDRRLLDKGQLRRNVKKEPYRKYLPVRVINDMMRQHEEEPLSSLF